jgi:hypothetical protein
MSRTPWLVVVVASVMVSTAATGADLTGSLLYDDRLLDTVFTDINATIVYALPQSGGQIEGTVDLATSSYTITGLEAGSYGVAIYLDRTDPTTNVGNPGDLRHYVNVDIPDGQSSVVQDLDLRYTYHIIEPIDSSSPLSGSGNDCTDYPFVDYPITFAIEPVPLAVSYRFAAFLYACPPSFLDLIEIETTETSTEIEWGTANEDYQNLGVTCTGASGKHLCNSPLIEYGDVSVWGLQLRNRDPNARAIHPSNAHVVAAVAGTPGAHGTYWSSAVSVTNLAADDRNVLFTYTPRDTDGLASYSESALLVPAETQVSWSDVLAELFSTTGAGALEIRGADLAVTSRTSTPGDPDGSYGQGIPPIQPEQILTATKATAAAVGGVEESAAFRTNLGLCEVWGESATVRVTVLDSSMTVLGDLDLELRPFENTQLNQVARVVAGVTSLADGVVRVTVLSGKGRVGAYLSVVDNATGDPTYIAIAPQSPIGG